MQPRKHCMPKGFHKHKILLDENMRPRRRFPRLNSRFDVKHIDGDLHHGGLPDPEVYLLAVRQQRILVTYNIKHFLALAGTQADCGIIGISPHFTDASQVDAKLTALLLRSTPKSLAGKFTDLAGEM